MMNEMTASQVLSIEEEKGKVMIVHRAGALFPYPRSSLPFDDQKTQRRPVRPFQDQTRKQNERRCCVRRNQQKSFT
jgi:hypothetical protein